MAGSRRVTVFVPAVGISKMAACRRPFGACPAIFGPTTLALGLVELVDQGEVDPLFRQSIACPRDETGPEIAISREQQPVCVRF